MTFNNELTDVAVKTRRRRGEPRHRRGSVSAVVVDDYNIVELKREDHSELKWLGRLLCYTSAILSVGLVVAFALTIN